MPQATKGMYHLHKRKTKPLNSNDKRKQFIDKLVYFAAFAGPLMTLPQAWKIWFYQNASGVSWISWFSYFICAIIWVIYGVEHKDKPIIAMNVLWIILDVLIVVGTLMYG